MAQRRVIESEPENLSAQAEKKADMPKESAESKKTVPKPKSEKKVVQTPSTVSKKSAVKPRSQSKSASSKKAPLQTQKPQNQSVSPKKTAVMSAPKTDKKGAVGPSKKKAVAPKKFKSRKTSKKSESKSDDAQEGMGFLPVIISILLFIAFLAAVVYTTQNPLFAADPQFGDFKAKQVQTFPQLIEKIVLLDAQYSTDWHEERLGKDMINPQFIDAYLEQLDLLEQAVNASEGNETDINLAFLDVRKRMLLSQKAFQEALRYGTEGVVTETFSCDQSRVDKVLAASNLYNESFHIGQKAFPRLDEVLRKSTESRDLVGVNLAKPRWYVTEFGNIKYLAETNIELVNTLCFSENENKPE